MSYPDDPASYSGDVKASLDAPLMRIYTLDEARDSVLCRLPPDEMTVPEIILQRIAELFGQPLSPNEAVQRVVADVRARGDEALRDWNARLDGAHPTTLEVSSGEVEAGLAATPAPVVAALQLAAQRIEHFHRQQPAASWFDTIGQDRLGQLVRPLERVGIYVPGGSAPLPSSLLMCAIPARVAGVREIVVCTPPGRSGLPPVLLAAAHIARVDRVFQVGGAQAIAAMAYGTASIPRVDKIVGPGNLFVTLAKRQVYGAVGIDGLLGPTETMIIADDGANPEFIAADLLAQAEHDVLAQAILVTPSRLLAERVVAAVERRAARLSRRGIIEQSLAGRGGAVIVPDLPAAFEVANAYAPEHLQLCLPEAERYLDWVHHAGAVFLGEYSFEVLADYVVGPSHSLPTSGSARYASGLSVRDFVILLSVIDLSPATARQLARPASVLAHAEGLTAHAAAAEARCD